MPIDETGPKLNLFKILFLSLFSASFDEDPINNEVAIVRTTFPPLYVYERLNGK